MVLYRVLKARADDSTSKPKRLCSLLGILCIKAPSLSPGTSENSYVSCYRKHPTRNTDIGFEERILR